MNMKIKEYSIFAASLLATSYAKAQGTIMYHDFNPDKEINIDDTVSKFSSFYDTLSYNLDIDNDGANDFRFELLDKGYIGTAAWEFEQMTLMPLGQNKVLGDTLTANSFFSSNVPYYGATILSSNKTINSSAGWLNKLPEPIMLCERYSFASTNWINGWNGKIEKYLGFAITKNAGDYYGWMRLSVNYSSKKYFQNKTIKHNQITIHDYAYNDQAYAPITTGEMLTSVNENELAKKTENLFTVYSFDKKVYIYSKDKSAFVSQISIVNLLGKVVYETTTDKIQTVLNPILTTGIYLVEITTNRGVFLKNVFIN